MKKMNRSFGKSLQSLDKFDSLRAYCKCTCGCYCSWVFDYWAAEGYEKGKTEARAES